MDTKELGTILSESMNDAKEMSATVMSSKSLYSQCGGTIKQPPLSDAEKKRIVEKIQAMNREDLEVVIDVIPVELCYNRIGRELKKNKEFAKAVKDSISLLGG